VPDNDLIFGFKHVPAELAVHENLAVNFTLGNDPRRVTEYPHVFPSVNQHFSSKPREIGDSLLSTPRSHIYRVFESQNLSYGSCQKVQTSFKKHVLLLWLLTKKIYPPETYITISTQKSLAGGNLDSNF